MPRPVRHEGDLRRIVAAGTKIGEDGDGLQIAQRREALEAQRVEAIARQQGEVDSWGGFLMASVAIGAAVGGPPGAARASARCRR